MKNLEIPSKENLSINNQVHFENLEKALGFVPNMYAFFAHSATALGDYLNLQNRKSSLSKREREAINLVVSQLNECNYCKAAHTSVGKMAGFTEEQTLEIRKANITFNSKLNALVNLTKEITKNKGNVPQNIKDSFFNEGYTLENLVDVVMVVGDKIITNYLFALANVPIDFPLAKEL